MADKTYSNGRPAGFEEKPEAQHADFPGSRTTSEENTEDSPLHTHGTAWEKKTVRKIDFRLLLICMCHKHVDHFVVSI